MNEKGGGGSSLLAGGFMEGWKFAIATADDAPNSAPILLCGRVQENLKKAMQLGYDAIEIHTREDAIADIDDIKKTMLETGVCVSAIVTGRLNTEGRCSLIADEPYIVSATICGMKKYVEELVCASVPAIGASDMYIGTKRKARIIALPYDYAEHDSLLHYQPFLFLYIFSLYHKIFFWQ